MNSRKYMLGVEHDVGEENVALQNLAIVSAPGDVVGIELENSLIKIFNQFKIPIVRNNRYLASVLKDLDIDDPIHSYWMNLMRQATIENSELKFVGIDNGELINKIKKDLLKVIGLNEHCVSNETRDRVINGYLIDRENYFVKRIEETNPNIVIVGDFHVDFLKHKFPDYNILSRTIRKKDTIPKSWIERYKELRYSN